jgi:hypothetical protein
MIKCMMKKLGDINSKWVNWKIGIQIQPVEEENICHKQFQETVYHQSIIK